MTEEFELYVVVGRRLVLLGMDMREDGCSHDMIERAIQRELRGLAPDLARQVAAYLDGPD